ncbi:hypothetical protein [Saccharopolyspora gloriosae]|uniref:hypothetical protein n=1 Tax=Saccharopolyspora gloriosae TaxID=455344 RepID=UPI0037CC3E90
MHYRDLDVVERELAEARAGRFHWEPLAFHLAGIPSYLVVAELAGNQVLSGSLPSPEFPDALRRSAPAVWAGQAVLSLAYATSAHGARGRVTQCAGLLAQAACQVGHAVLAARGEWVTNEKRLLQRAGLRDVDDLLAELKPGTEQLVVTAGAVRSRLERALAEVHALPAT